VIETPRLRLRRWRPDDVDELTRIFLQPGMLRFFSRRLAPDRSPREQVAEHVARLDRECDTDGHCLWAAELRETGRLIGRIGLKRHTDWTAGPDPVEVGWLVDQDFQGRGLATEGGRAGLEFAFTVLGLSRVISITDPENAPSRRVMEKLGLECQGPALWREREVVWYAADRERWLAGGGRLGTSGSMDLELPGLDPAGVDRRSFVLGAAYAFVEMVAAGVKPLALSLPLHPGELSSLLPALQGIAAHYRVSAEVDEDFLVTPLFDPEFTRGRVVVLLAREAVLERYHALKATRAQAAADGSLAQAEEGLARGLGELLGYSAEAVDGLLRQPGFSSHA